ncbi:MAG: hypothetical protein RL354_2389, partial [Planctomycetota bacterium]
PAELLADTPTAEGIFEREWARAIVSDACEVVERELHDAGDARLWAMFARHVLDGRTYVDIAAEQGVTAAAARNATRLVRERVDRALERLLLDEGVPPSDVSAELTRIQSLLARGPE